MIYFKKNLVFVIFSFIFCLVTLVAFSAEDSVKLLNILNSQNWKSCSELTFPWVQQTCLESMVDAKEKSCYLDECKSEVKEMKSHLKGTIPYKLGILVIFFISVLILTETLILLWRKVRNRVTSGYFLDRIDGFLEKKGLTKKEIKSKPALVSEVIYLLVLTSAFFLFWFSFAALIKLGTILGP